MRALLTIFTASTLLASSAIAAPIAADAPQQPTAQQMDAAVGSYRLSDNRRADIFMSEGQLYVRIGHRPRKQLVVAGQNRYATRDGSLAIQLVPDANDDRIVLEQDRGIGQPDTIRLASNERAGRGGAD
jgi:hypothetical protein